MGKTAVLIPIYKISFSKMETVSLNSSLKRLKEYDICFIGPESLAPAWGETAYFKIPFISYPDEYFKSFRDYSRLLMTEAFYRDWLDRGYQKILICQTDVYVLKTDLERFLSLPYDYIGAPLMKITSEGRPDLYGGNGGFSLRDLKAVAGLLHGHKADIGNGWDCEDEFFSACGEKYPKEFRTAPLDVSSHFSFDRFPGLLYERNGRNLPLAIHGWMNIDPTFTQNLIRQVDPDADLPEIGRTKEEAMRGLLTYASSHAPLVIYGAGTWGKVFCHYLSEVKGIPVACFAVSFGQKGSGTCLGHDVVPADRLDPALKDHVLLGISTNYMSASSKEDLHRSLSKNGIVDPYKPDVMQYAGALEEWYRISD